jgi:hypothetical protein
VKATTKTRTTDSGCWTRLIPYTRIRDNIRCNTRWGRMDATPHMWSTAKEASKFQRRKRSYAVWQRTSRMARSITCVHAPYVYSLSLCWLPQCQKNRTVDYCKSSVVLSVSRARFIYSEVAFGIQYLAQTRLRPMSRKTKGKQITVESWNKQRNSHWWCTEH